MRLWSIRFQGIWPVGAVAVATADTAEEAEARFRQLWSDAHPTHDPGELETQEVPLEPGMVRVLLDGEY